MGDLQILKELFKRDALQELEKNYHKFQTTLSEPSCPDSSVIIADIPEDSLVVKIDKFPDPSAVFNGGKGECRRADFLIIAEYSGKKRVLFIELKRTKDEKVKIIQQLKGAVCALTYCQEAGKQFWNKSSFLDEFEFRFISFGHTAIRKRRTRIRREVAALHNTPEKMMKIDWPANIRFNHLAGA
jgi:hypothetical protein